MSSENVPNNFDEVEDVGDAAAMLRHLKDEMKMKYERQKEENSGDGLTASDMARAEMMGMYEAYDMAWQIVSMAEGDSSE